MSTIPLDPSSSILARATKHDVVREPFPYLVLRDALEPSLFERLEREYPDPALVMQEASRGVRYFRSAASVVGDDRVSLAWRAFFAYHSSPRFWSEVVALLGDEIRRLHPGLEPALGMPLDALAVGMHRARQPARSEHGRLDVALDCQYYLNWTREPSETARLHVDHPARLYKALLYLRDPREGTNTGGEVEICRERPGGTLFREPGTIRVSGLPREVDRSQVEVARTIRFEPNTLVLVLNSARSLHAVSVRTTATWPRRHIYLSADLSGHALFEVRLPVGLRLRLAVRHLLLIARAWSAGTRGEPRCSLGLSFTSGTTDTARRAHRTWCRA